MLEFSTEATLKASGKAAGDPKVASSHFPSASSSPPDGEKFKPEFPAEITGSTPASLAFFNANPVALDVPLKPLSDPSDMLITSAPSFTESSIAATISESRAPCEPGMFENTFIASSCAFGATPSTRQLSLAGLPGSSPLAATIPATCMPCCSAPLSVIV